MYDVNDKGTVRHFINFRYRSAIDKALEGNQISAVQCMIMHVVKHQNKYAFANLFIHNFVKLILAGLRINELLNSQVFSMKLEFNEWPSIDYITDEVILPYNGSPLNIKYRYDELFNQKED